MVEGRELFVSHMRNPQPCNWRFRRDPATGERVGAHPGAPVISIRINDDWMSWKAVHLENPLNRKVGLLLSEATHFTDLANWFMDAKPTRVFCSGQGVLNHGMLIHYDNGGMASISMAATGSFGYPKELLEAMGQGAVVAVDHMLEIRTAGIADTPAIKTFPMLEDRHPGIGTEGGVRGWMLKKRAACDEAAAANDPMLQFTAEPDKGHALMLEEFCREIRGERGPVCPVGDAVMALKICFAAITSYMEGREVEIVENSQ